MSAAARQSLISRCVPLVGFQIGFVRQFGLGAVGEGRACFRYGRSHLRTRLAQPASQRVEKVRDGTGQSAPTSQAGRHGVNLLQHPTRENGRLRARKRVGEDDFALSLPFTIVGLLSRFIIVFTCAYRITFGISCQDIRFTKGKGIPAAFDIKRLITSFRV